MRIFKCSIDYEQIVREKPKLYKKQVDYEVQHSQNENVNIRKCTNDKKNWGIQMKNKSLLIGLLMMLIIILGGNTAYATCSLCMNNSHTGCTEGFTRKYYDSTYHYVYCKCCSVLLAREEHTYYSSHYISCSRCGHRKGTVSGHEFGKYVSNNSGKHYNYCVKYPDCATYSSLDDCYDNNNDLKCDACGFQMSLDDSDPTTEIDLTLDGAHYGLKNTTSNPLTVNVRIYSAIRSSTYYENGRVVVFNDTIPAGVTRYYIAYIYQWNSTGYTIFFGYVDDSGTSGNTYAIVAEAKAASSTSLSSSKTYTPYIDKTNSIQKWVTNKSGSTTGYTAITMSRNPAIAQASYLYTPLRDNSSKYDSLINEAFSYHARYQYTATATSYGHIELRYTLDTTKPTVAKNGTASPSVANSSTNVSIPLKFSDAGTVYTASGVNTSTIAASDITVKVGGTTVSPTKTLTQEASADSNPCYTLDLNGITGNGALTLEFAAGVFADKAGNTNAATTITPGITIDNTAPTVTLGSSSITYGSSTTVKVTDSVSSSLTYAISTGNTAPTSGWASTTSGTAVTIGSNLSVGTYYVFGRDQAGNTSYKQLNVTNATMSGSITITGTNNCGQTLTANTSSISPSGCTLKYQWWYSTSSTATSGTNISGATGSTYKIGSGLTDKYIGVTVTASKTYYTSKSFTDVTNATISHTGGTATCTNLAVCTGCGGSYGSLNSSNHNYTVKCTTCGTANVICSYNNSHVKTHTCDVIAPTGSATIPSYTTTGSVTVTATATDTGGSGMDSVKFPTWSAATNSAGNAQDDIVWYTATSSTSSYSYTIDFTKHSPGTEGRYNIHVYAYDKAGNNRYLNGKEVIYDKTAPTIGSITGTQYKNTASGGTVAVTASSLSDSLSGISYCDWYYKIGTGSWSSAARGTISSTNSTYNVPITSEGTYTVRIWLYDKAGNGTYKDTTIVVDRTAPTMNSFTSSSSTYTGSNITLTGKATDSFSGIVAYAFTKGSATPSYTTINRTTSQITQTTTVKEVDTYYFWVKDAAGNVKSTSLGIVYPTLTVTFYRNHSSSDTTTASKTYTYGASGNAFQSNNFTRTGYTLAGWSATRSATSATWTVTNGISNSWILSNTPSISIYAIWTPNTNTAYKVNHYQMNLDGSTYTLKETDSLTGTSDSSVTPAVKSYTGFTSPTTQTTTIKPDGTTVVNYYYTRNKYYLDLNGWLDGASNGGIAGYGTADVYVNGSASATGVGDYYQQIYYGSTYEIKNIKAAAGHTYLGVYSGSLSGTMGTGNVGVSLNFITNISISTHPASIAVKQGATASFNVSASGYAPTYQWQYRTNSSGSWSNISGATSASYTTAATTSAMNGYQYRCVITNNGGSVTSNASTLTVYYPPKVATHPSNATVTYPAKATFTVVATAGNPSTTYQWQYRTNSSGSWSNISGATSASYTTAATTVAMTGYQYRCIISNSQYANAATSNAATLTVNRAAGSVTASISGTTTVGQTLTASGSTASDGTKTYQWWRASSATATSGTNIGTGSTYKLVAADAGYYIGVTVSVAQGSNYLACSDTAITSVTIKDIAAAVTTHPTNQTVTYPAKATFTAAGSGSNLKYQWQYRTSSSGSWANVTSSQGTGGTTTSFTTVATTVAMTGYQYRCVISNNAGSVNSNAATLTVNRAAGSVTASISGTTTVGQTLTASGTTASDGTKTYQWWRASSATATSGTNLGTGSTYKLVAADAGYYIGVTVSVAQGSNYLACSDTAITSVTIKDIVATVITHPTNQTVTYPAKATFTVAASGSNLKYQWQYRTSSSGSWANVTSSQGTGGTTASFTTVATTVAMSGYQYRCVISNNAGSVNSNAATLTVNPKSISGSDITITLNPTSYIYDKTEKKPSVTVKDTTRNVTLTNNTDYTFAYSNNINAGTGKVTITGKGNYTGTKEATFTINRANPTITLSTTNIRVVEKNTITFTYTYNGDGAVSITNSDSSKATATLTANGATGTVTIKGVAAGTTKITVKAAQGANYNAVESAAVTVTVDSANYRVNDIYYQTLEEAYNSISGTEGTIVVEKDNTDNSTFTVASNKKITLNTNGKTIIKTVSGLTNNGTLNIDGNGTIKTSEVIDLITNKGILNLNGAGAINQENSTSDQYNAIHNDGSVKINGNTTITAGNRAVATNGTIEMNAGSVMAVEIAIRLTGNGSLILKNGKLESTGDRAIVADSTAETPITISGGEIKSKNAAVSANNAKGVIINGGTIISEVDNGVYISGNSALTIGTNGNGVSTASPVIQGKINGVQTVGNTAFNFYDGILKGGKNALNATGTITTEEGYNIYKRVEGSYEVATLTVSNYRDNVKDGNGIYNYYATLADAFKIAPSGSTITLLKNNLTDDSIAELSNGKTLTLDMDGNTLIKSSTAAYDVFINNGTLNIIGNGTITATNFANAIENRGTLYVENTTINSPDTVADNVAIRSSSGTVTLKNVTLNGAECGLHNTNGTAILENTNVTARNGSGIYTDSNLNITGGTIKGNDGIYINGGTITINSGTITASGNGIYNPGGKVIIGNKDGKILTSPSITGGYQGIFSNGNIEFYDGIFKGKTAAMNINGSTTMAEINASALVSKEAGYDIVDNTETISNEVYKTAYLGAANYSVGNNFYETLERAYTLGITGSEGTIVVRKDNIDTSEFIVKYGKNVTLDMNDKTITKQDKAITVYNAGTLNIVGDGTITGGVNHNVIQNEGTLNLSDATIRSENEEQTYYAIRNKGTLLINSGTVSARGTAIYNTGKATIEGGEILGTGDNEGNFNKKYVRAVYNINGELYITDGKLSAENPGSSYGVRTVGGYGGKIEITGGEIIAKAPVSATAVESYSTASGNIGEIKISDDVIITATATGATGQAIGVQANCSDGITQKTNVTILGGTITATANRVAYGIDTEKNTGDLIITGGTIKSSGQGINVVADHTGKVQIGTNDGNINKEEPLIVAEKDGVLSAKGFDFYDGIIKSKTNALSVNGTINVPTGYAVVNNIETINNETYKTAYLGIGNYKVGDYAYETLERAYTVGITGTSGTITVEKDNIDDSELIIDSTKSVTIDTKGNTLTKSTVGLVNNGTLIITGTGTIVSAGTNEMTLIDNNGSLEVIENTKFSNTNGYVIDNTGITTLQNGEYRGTKPIHSSGNSSSKIIINGDNVIVIAEGNMTKDNGAITLEGSSVLEMNKGTVSASSGIAEVKGILVKGNSSANISGGTITASSSVSTSINQADAIAVISNGDVNISGDVNITGTRSGITLLDTNTGDVYITGGTIVGGQVGIFNNSNASVEIGIEDDEATGIISPEIRGEEIAYVSFKSDSQLLFYDGVLESRGSNVIYQGIIDSSSNIITQENINAIVNDSTNTHKVHVGDGTKDPIYQSGYEVHLTTAEIDGKTYDIAYLRIYTVPIINGPRNATIKLNETATFEVTVIGGVPSKYTYEWQVSTDGGNTWTLVENGNEPVYETPRATVEMNGYKYRCIVSNGIFTVNSSVVSLTIDEASLEALPIDIVPIGKITFPNGDKVSKVNGKDVIELELVIKATSQLNKLLFNEIEIDVNDTGVVAVNNATIEKNNYIEIENTTGEIAEYAYSFKILVSENGIYTAKFSDIKGHSSSVTQTVDTFKDIPLTIEYIIEEPNIYREYPVVRFIANRGVKFVSPETFKDQMINLGNGEYSMKYSLNAYAEINNVTFKFVDQSGYEKEINVTVNAASAQKIRLTSDAITLDAISISDAYAKAQKLENEIEIGSNKALQTRYGVSSTQVDMFMSRARDVGAAVILSNATVTKSYDAVLPEEITSDESSRLSVYGIQGVSNEYVAAFGPNATGTSISDADVKYVDIIKGSRLNLYKGFTISGFNTSNATQPYVLMTGNSSATNVNDTVQNASFRVTIINK